MKSVLAFFLTVIVITIIIFVFFGIAYMKKYHEEVFMWVGLIAGLSFIGVIGVGIYNDLKEWLDNGKN